MLLARVHNRPKLVRRFQDMTGWHKYVAWPEGITVWVVFATMVAIVWQAVETRRAVAAANRSTEVSKTKERAKLLLIKDPLNPVLGKIPELKLEIMNAGESSAIVEWASAGLDISSTEMANAAVRRFQLKVMGTLLRAGDVSRETVWWADDIFYRYTQKVLDAKDIVHLYGRIRYMDAFDEWWVYEFHYVWQQFGGDIWMPHLQANAVGGWDLIEDSVYRVTKPSKKRRWQFWRKSNPSLLPAKAD
jgi:hypothetical protein